SNWGNVSDFIILESDGEPVATCAVFKPEPAPSSEGPLNLDKLDQVAWSLSWSDDAKASFLAGYEMIWGNDASFLKPQAELIIETDGDGRTVERWPGVRQYVLQAENFVDTVRTGAAYPWTLEQARGSQAMIDWAFRAAGHPQP
ncbi:MAG: hypothetical protein AAGF91_12305, partial [Actinomycetota bacterium]